MKLLADENFNRAVLAGIESRCPNEEIATVEGEQIRGIDDDSLLALAAAQGRILLTHDENSLVGLAWARVARHERMPGVILVPWTMPPGSAVLRVSEFLASHSPEDLDNAVHFP